MDNSTGEKWSLRRHIEKKKRKGEKASMGGSAETAGEEETYLGVPVSELTAEERASKERVEKIIKDAAERADPNKSKDLTVPPGVVPGKMKPRSF